MKLFLGAIVLCAVGYIGYTAYEKVTTIDVERLMLQNIEALAEGEGEGDQYKYIWTLEYYILDDGTERYRCVRGGNSACP